MSADFLARAGASLGVAGLLFLYIYMISGAYPPLVIGLIYLALGPGFYLLLFLALFVVDLCLVGMNLLNLLI